MNYMVYLLFVNTEMLLPGSRRNLFTKAHREVEAMAMFMDTEPPLDKGALTEEIGRELDPPQGSNVGAPEGDVGSDPGCLGGDALLLRQQMQRL